MAKKRNALDRLREQIADLPRLGELVIEGGPSHVDVSVRDAGTVIEPIAVLWVESPSGWVRAFELIDPRGDLDQRNEQALRALCSACAQPVGAGPAATSATPPTAAPDSRIVDLAAARAQRQVARPPSARPGLPARIVVLDRTLADPVRSLFGPLGVAVEYREHSPVFEAAATELARCLDTIAPTGDEPFEWDVDVTLLRELCKAVTGFHRRAPWDYLPDTPPLRIDLGANGPEPGVATLYASVLGAGGMVDGVAFYYSLADVVQAMESGADLEPAADADIDAMVALLRQSGVPVDQIPPDTLHEMVGTVLDEQGLGGSQVEDLAQNSLAVLFASEEETGTNYADWFKARDIKPPARDRLPMFVRTEVGQKTRHPSDREVIAMTLALEALNQFCSRHRQALAGPFLPLEPITLAARIATGAGSNSAGAQATVEVTFPPPEWEGVAAEGEEDEGVEEPDLPATEAGAVTVYHFLVTLDTEDEVWRRVELRGDQTMHDLHRIIQDAFEWDDDHEYAFYLSGVYYDEKTAYDSPGSGATSAARHRLEHMPLRAHQRFAYLFDFGDEWRHEITLEQIDTHGVAPGVSYPRITERHGDALEQYPQLDDYDEGDELDGDGETERDDEPPR